MKNYFTNLMAVTLPDWVTTFLPILRMVFLGIICLCSISLIITVLMQSNSSSGGMNAISGSQESYYAQNKGGTREGRLKKLTIAAASIIGILIVLFFITLLIYNPTSAT